jgi:hypothetical protein
VKVYPYACSKCEKRYATESNLLKHESKCEPAEPADDEPCDDDSKPQARRPFETPETEEIGSTVDCPLLMGHGLVGGPRIGRPLDSLAEEILEELYQMGVTKSSNRKGIHEMVEACRKKLPALLAPDHAQVSSWLSSRLKRANSESQSRQRNRVKSMFLKRQEEAASISNVHNEKRSDPNKKDLWLAKYRGVCLKVDGAVWMVTSVAFESNKWFLVTKKANKSKYDDREYLQDSSSNETRYIEVNRNAASKHIKEFNKSYTW